MHRQSVSGVSVSTQTAWGVPKRSEKALVTFSYSRIIIGGLCNVNIFKSLCRQLGYTM